MVVKQLDEPYAFLEATTPYLLEDEARNNLILGLAGTLWEHPAVYDEHELWVVEDADETIAAALRTPPYNLVLAGPASRRAMTALAEHIRGGRIDLPGCTGAVPEVHHFASMWAALTESPLRRRRDQRIYRLQTVRPVMGMSGSARAATEDDRPLLGEWLRAFSAEAIPEDAPGRDVEHAIAARLNDGTGGFAIWEDDGPVALAGWGGRTPNGVRIGPVYTPPEHRRRGYGSAVTGAVSAEQLDSGHTFCFLYTDLANPTSNRIYMNIGYEPICDSIEYGFDGGHE
ncbi:MAG: GNAT family N-acetyltransferase [Gaiellaceae bacterium]